VVLVRVMLAAHFPVHALVTVACVTLYDVESRTPILSEGRQDGCCTLQKPKCALEPAIFGLSYIGLKL
jgi:hypothetical protein